MTQDSSRGFSVLVGETITAVDTSAINIVTLSFSNGAKYEIDSSNQFHGIAVVECNKLK